MKKIMKSTLGIFLIAVLMLNLCACSSKDSQPEELLSKLENAYNTQDIDILLDCFDPTIQNTCKSIAAVGGDMFGTVDFQTVINSLSEFVDIFNIDTENGIPQINFTINQKEYISDIAVKLNVTQKCIYKTIDVPDFIPKEYTTDLYFININDHWYISAKLF